MPVLTSRFNFSVPRQLAITIRTVFSLLWQIDRRLFLLLFFSNILDGLLTLPLIYVDKKFLDVLVGSIGKTEWESAVKLLAIIVAVKFVITFLNDVMARTIGVANNLLSWKFSNRMEIMLGEKFSSLDLATIEDPNFKDRYVKVQQDSYSKAWNLVGSLFQIPQSLAGMLSAITVLWVFHPALAILLICFVIPGFLVDAKFARLEYAMQTRHATIRRIWQMLSGYLTRTQYFMEIKVSQLSGHFAKRLRTIQEDRFKEISDLRTRKHLHRQLVNIPEQLFIALIDIYIGFLVITGRFTIGTGQALVRSVDIFNTRTRELLRSLIDIFESNLYITDLTWFLSLGPTIRNDEGRKFPRRITQGIVFDHVWFRYTPDSSWILKDVNFSIQAQENIALVGENGAGKTTLIKLLSRFYDPEMGEITIDGIPLRNYKRSEFWDNYAILFQEFATYPFTARESIGYGNLSRLHSLPSIRAYARKTDIDSFIMSLPKQYDNPISREFDGGVTPSFGQLQRIGIARSLIKDSQILVLDEPTSNVDPQAEEDIFNQVLKLGRKKILIFISHRLSTVRRADKIFLLENGTVAEAGTHSQLMAKRGRYAYLFNLQARSYN